MTKNMSLAVVPNRIAMNKKGWETLPHGIVSLEVFLEFLQNFVWVCLQNKVSKQKKPIVI